MKIQTEIIIDADRETVWRVFEDPEKLANWQSASTLQVTEKRKPDFVAGTYQSDNGTAIVVNHFEELPDGTTKWATWWNYTFTGLQRFVAPFKRKAIINQIEEDLNRFKLFVESE